MAIRTLTISFLLTINLALTVVARADTAPALTIWRLLDYMAIDYREAVWDGTVVSVNEYAEMVEFVGSMKEKLDALPPTDDKTHLQQKAVELQAAIGQKAVPDLVAKLARSLAADLIKAYPVPLAPSAIPDFQRGRSLYAERVATAPTATARVPPLQV